jgi:hypothetical protein
MTIVNAYASDPAVSAFLEKLGLPESTRKQPLLTADMLAQHGVDYGSLYAVVSQERHCHPSPYQSDLSLADVLNPEEAKAALRLMHAHGPRFSALFRSDQCPGAGTASQTVVNNFFDWDRSRSMHGTRAGVAAYEMACTVAQYGEFSPRELLGVHFVDATAGPLRTSGEAVIHLTTPDETNGGSAVVVHHRNNPAHRLLISAHHVFYERQIHYDYYSVPIFDLQKHHDGFHGAGILFPEATLLELIPFYEQYVAQELFYAQHNRLIRMDASGAMVHDQVRDIIIQPVEDFPADHPTIMPARRPPLPGESIWIVGFPGSAYSADEMRTYTPGIVDGYAGGQIYFQARGWFGNSGGAVLNSAGRLLGIVARFESTITSNFSSMSGPAIEEFYDPKEMAFYQWAAHAYFSETTQRHIPPSFSDDKSTRIIQKFSDFYRLARRHVELRAPGYLSARSYCAPNESARVVEALDQAGDEFFAQHPDLKAHPVLEITPPATPIDRAIFYMQIFSTLLSLGQQERSQRPKITPR